MLGSWEKFLISAVLLSIHNIIIVAVNLFRPDVQRVPRSRKSL